MQLKRRKSNQIAFKTVLLNEIEVLYKGYIVGYGLAYYDGETMLKPDIVSLTGEILPTDTYLLRFTSDPKLAVLAESVQ